MKREDIASGINSVQPVAKKARKECKTFASTTAEKEVLNDEQRSTQEGNFQSPNGSANQVFCKNMADLVSKVKQEAADNDIQTYAHHTMNELLGLYGYEKVVASDIGNLQEQSNSDENKDIQSKEAIKNTSPISFQSKPTRCLLNHSDEEDVTCCWCSRSSHAALSLQEEGNTKNFCSEKCFAACRRANFKRNRGNINSNKDEENGLFSANVKFLKATERDGESRQTSAKNSRLENTLHSKEKLFQKKEKTISKNNERPKIPGFKRKDRSSKFFDTKHPATGGQKMCFHQKNKFSDEALINRKETPTKHGHAVEESMANGTITIERFTRKQDLSAEFASINPPIKISSESKTQQPSEIFHTTPDQLLSDNFLREYPLLSLYTSASLPLMGVPNMATSLLGDVKFDLNSFRLGLLTALQQNKAVEHVSNSFFDSCPNSGNATLAQTCAQSQCSTTNKENPHSLATSNNDHLMTPVSAEASSLSKPVSNKEEAKSQISETQSDFQAVSQYGFSPILIMPLPIPVPIPIPFPVGCDQLLQHHVDENDSEKTPLKSASVNHSATAQNQHQEKLQLKSSDFDNNPNQICHDASPGPQLQETFSDACDVIDLSLRSQTQHSTVNGEQEMEQNESIHSSS